MDKIGLVARMMGNASTASIKLGQVSGAFSILSQQNQKNTDFAFTSSGEIKVHSFNDMRKKRLSIYITSF